MTLAVKPATLTPRMLSAVLHEIASLSTGGAVSQMLTPHVDWEQHHLDLEVLEFDVVQVFALEAVQIWICVIRSDEKDMRFGFDWGASEELW